MRKVSVEGHIRSSKGNEQQRRKQLDKVCSYVSNMSDEDTGRYASVDSKDSVKITVRILMHGKEVGGIIGKGGATIKAFREESGAHINISDGSTTERVVAISGTTDAVVKAFSLISEKIEEEMINNSRSSGSGQVSVRLVIPSSQCGAIIGKGGSKVKEIREASGASVQVAGEMLPGSTERAVTLLGNADSLTKCIEQLCVVLTEFPPKGTTMPYNPRLAGTHVIYHQGQPFAVHGQLAIPLTEINGGMRSRPNGYFFPPGNPGRAPKRGSRMDPTTQTMKVPNDDVGSIIGRHGTNISEIRQLTGAQIKIADPEDDSDERDICITGTPDAISLAQLLINSRIGHNSGQGNRQTSNSVKAKEEN